jgi:hypothetical protein
MKRVTYYSKEGTMYSEIDDTEDDEYCLEAGAWCNPFPNEKGNSQAFGLAETLLQSDYCPLRLKEEGIQRIMVEDCITIK